MEAVDSRGESNQQVKPKQSLGNIVKRVSAYSMGRPFIQMGKGIVDSQFWG